MMNYLLFILLGISSSFAGFDMGKAVDEGVSTGLGAVGGWLVLGIFIAFVFAFITKGRK